MKRNLLLLHIILLSLLAEAQSPPDTALRIVSWNVEWFGSTEAGPSNKNLQEQNVLKILRYLDADIYALAEIVDTLRFRRLVDSLGSGYGYRLSDYCSIIASPDYPGWLTCQKLAFIFKNDVVSNVRVRGMLRGSNNAYGNFASGRFPYLMNANVNKQGKKRNINIINIHAKAGSTTTDYTRRRNAAIELKDTLDRYFSTVPVMLAGDFNDELHRSISGQSTSPYQGIVADSIKSNTNYYHSITLPLSYAGENSTISFPTVIDHQVINKRMDSMFISGSAAIRQDVVAVVPNYISRNTSDHYPVFSRYSIIAGDTSEVVQPPPPPPPVVSIRGYQVAPNPFKQTVNFTSEKTLSNVSLVLYNSTGLKVWQYEFRTIPANVRQSFQITSALPSGLYILRLESREESRSFKLLK